MIQQRPSPSFLGEPNMPRANPYRSPDAFSSTNATDEPSSAAGRPQPSAKLVRSLEYAISLLIVVALIWVVHVFVLAGDIL
jgi:hypothetical protein